MKLLWKLLRQHLSIGQFAGFFLANLFGVVIVLFAFQFYHDVLPVFTQPDSFMKKEYLVISKKVNMLGSLFGKNNSFGEDEISRLKEQPFTKDVGAFIPCRYSISAYINVMGQNVDLSTQLFFESVPDRFLDVKTDNWTFNPAIGEIPIILPKNYLNLYNYGFAQSRNLPQISESMLGLFNVDLYLKGNGESEKFKGRIVGFSNRLNTLLVPESFVQWSNVKFGNTDGKSAPARMIVEVDNPSDDKIEKYFDKYGYETEGGQSGNGRMVYFLKIITSLVIGIGLCISALSFFILMLSIYLLLQKNTQKLETLLLLGYSPARVSFPYQLLTIGLNLLVLIAAWSSIVFLRSVYLSQLKTIWPEMQSGSLLPAIGLGVLLLCTVTLINVFAIWRKVVSLWRQQEK